MSLYCNDHPDEKGIETSSPPLARGLLARIAVTIPIKRELKLGILNVKLEAVCNCNDYPDEKGIETSSFSLRLLLFIAITVTIPTKRELKHRLPLLCR